MEPHDVEDHGLAVDLLYPFYLDVDMSMAYTAALIGGVALEEEQVERGASSTSRSRDLRGAMRAVRAMELEAAGSRQNSEEGSLELRATRKHTEASVFIDLYNELRSRGRIGAGLDPGVVQVGDLVEARVGPAVLPLRRVPPEDDADDDEVRVGDDVAAINPAVTGPAVQILPLAICS